VSLGLPVSTEPSTVGQMGLTSAQAGERLRTFGPNIVVPKRRYGRLRRWAGIVADPMVLLLLVASGIYLALGEVSDAAVMGAALVPVLAMNVLLEGRAEHTLEKLRALNEPRATVMRDGQWRGVPIEELVPGDVIRVQEGGVLPADGFLLDGSDVMADESALTGESQPVSKQPSVGMLLAGSSLLSGRGVAEIRKTGASTEYGQIGQLLGQLKTEATPLQQGIRHLVGRLFIGALVLCGAVVALTIARGMDPREAFLGGVSLGIATIPEELPVIYSLYLTLGAWRLARDNALVRRMAGVETLGATTVICSDKTGTITFGHMALADLWPVADGDGGREHLRSAAALACEPHPFDPMEQAIVAGAPAGVYDGLELAREYEFDPVDKYMSHVWRSAQGLTIYAKGALEGILARCAIDDALRARAEAANAVMARQAMRVLAVAGRRLDRVSGVRATDERDLQLFGLIGVSDTVRPEVAAAVRECRRAGIRVVMITGDHPITARAIAEQAGFANHPQVASSEALVNATPEQWRQAVQQTDVFARIRPSEKLAIVDAFKSLGEVVAMTGDGINDAPALRAAHIGVSMGQRGTEVAREAATMVLLDDDFSTIVTAVREGRRILGNVRRAFSYLVAFHVPFLLPALLAPLLGLPLLLQPAHLVWLQLVVHTTSTLAFERDQPDPRAMTEPPVRQTRALVDNRRLVRAVLEGLGLFAVVWAAYTWGLGHGWPEALARNFGFTTLLLGQAGVVLPERAEGAFWRVANRGNRLLPLLLGLSALSALLPYYPGFAEVLHVQALSAAQFGIATCLALASFIWSQLLWLVWPQPERAAIASDGDATARAATARRAA